MKEEMLKFAQNFLTDERRAIYGKLMTDEKHTNFQEILSKTDTASLYRLAKKIYEDHKQATENGVKFSASEEEKTENFLIHLSVAIEEQLKENELQRAQI